MAKLAGMPAVGDLQVRAAFEVSSAQLAEGDARLFRLLGLHPGPDFDASAVAVLARIEVETAQLVLDRLVLASLVVEEGPSRFGMHDRPGPRRPAVGKWAPYDD